MADTSTNFANFPKLSVLAANHPEGKPNTSKFRKGSSTFDFRIS